MAFQMAFNKEELSGVSLLPAGKYTLQIKGFKPKAAKPKPPSTESESVSLNCELAVIGNPEYEGRRVFAGLNTKMAFMWQDFVHATGLLMEVVQDEFAGTEKENLTIPGIFEGASEGADPSTWNYLGPLLNKTMEVEIAVVPASAQYKAKNEIRQYFCAIPGCMEKHSTNLIKG